MGHNSSIYPVQYQVSHCFPLPRIRGGKLFNPSPKRSLVEDNYRSYFFMSFADC